MCVSSDLSSQNELTVGVICWRATAKEISTCKVKHYGI